MARSITPTRCARHSGQGMADTGGPVRDPGLEARVARLESDVAHMRGDVAEVKATLARLAPRIDEMLGILSATLPTLATKAAPAEQRSELKAELAEQRSELKAELAEQRSELNAELAQQKSALKAGIAELRLQIMQRPTRRQAVFDIFAIVGLIGAVLTIAARLAY
jgi:chromosome segregation ATPase